MSSIDVIVPCYGYGRYLRECVMSVLSQEVPNLRVLIINDASPDDTQAVAHDLVSEDSRVSYVQHLQNKGHIATYNEGIAWARARYLLLLSADDFLLPGALRRATCALDANPDVGLHFGEARGLADDGSTWKIRVPLNFSAVNGCVVLDGHRFIELCASMGALNIVPTPTAVVRTCLLKDLGGYAAELPHSADLELWLRLAAYSKVAIAGAEQAVYRRHSANMSLGFQADHGLRDLEQRAAAIDTFIRACNAVLPSPSYTERRLKAPLAREAVALAGDAIENRNRVAADALSTFALSLYPSIRCSFRWGILSLKRLLGAKVLGALRPAVTYLRRNG